MDPRQSDQVAYNLVSFSALRNIRHYRSGWLPLRPELRHEHSLSLPFSTAYIDPSSPAKL